MQPQAILLVSSTKLGKAKKCPVVGETWWHAGSPLAFGRRAHSHFTKPLCFTQLYITQGVCRHCLHVNALSTVTVYYTMRSTFQFHQTPTLGA